MSQANLSPSSKPPRREREAERRRTEILESAERIFADKGFHLATMEDVARDSEFAVGTLYKVFKSKDELYAAILEEKSAIFGIRCREAIRGDDAPKAKIARYVRARFSLFQEFPAFFSLYYHETMGTQSRIGARLTPDIAKRYREFRQLLANVFEEGIESGEFKHADPVLLTSILEGMIHGYLAEFSQHKEDPDAHKGDSEILARTLLEGILR
jgi:AcrR family transcriptional regulator